jgi:hypothetical protein
MWTGYNFTEANTDIIFDNDKYVNIINIIASYDQSLINDIDLIYTNKVSDVNIYDENVYNTMLIYAKIYQACKTIDRLEKYKTKNIIFYKNTLKSSRSIFV